MTRPSGGVLEASVRLAYKSGLTYRDAVEHFRRAFLIEALQASVNGRGRPNLCRVAKELGMHRNTLSRLIHELKIELPKDNRGGNR